MFWEWTVFPLWSLRATEDSSIQCFKKGHLHVLQIIFPKREALYRVIKYYNYKFIPWRTRLWFISFVSICKERRESHFKMLFRSLRKEVLKYQLPYHQISQRAVQRLLCRPLHKALLQSWEDLSDRGVMKDRKKDRHIKFLQFVKNRLVRKSIITRIISFSKIFAVLNTLLKPKQV